MNHFKLLLAQNGTAVALVVLIGYFAIASPRFLSVSNGQVILLQIAELGMIALPLAFLVMAGTLDLSVGSIASVSAITGAMTMTSTHSVMAGLLAGLVFGGIAGALNGFLTAYVGLNPMVVTLGFLSVWGGLALFLTSGRTVVGFPEDFKALNSLSLGPVPMQIIGLACAIALAWVVLNKLPFGRNVLAIGGNPRAAYLMGINVKKTRFSLFVITGLMAALSGLMLTAKLQSAPPTVGSGMEISALTVVLLGGVAFAGGSGRITGVVSGLLFVGVLRNGLVILGVSQFLQTILVGATLVLAVLLDQSIQTLIRSSWAKIQRPATGTGTQREARTHSSLVP